MRDRYMYGDHITITPAQFAEATNGILQECEEIVRMAIVLGIQDTLRNSTKEIKKAGSFKDRRPKYRKSIAWRIDTRGFYTEGQIYAKGNESALTHLLENGHELWNMPGKRTKAYVHWKVGELSADAQIIPNIEKYIKF